MVDVPDDARARQFEHLYATHRREVYATCLRLAGDRARAEEWTQDTFVRIWEQWERLVDPTDAGAWVHTVAVRVACNARRGDMRRLARVSLRDDAVPALPEAAEATASVFATPMPLRRVGLERALEQLRGRERTVFMLHDVEGHSAEEIGSLLRLSPSTVRVHLARARARLRRALSA